jgi:hypothetical protein
MKRSAILITVIFLFIIFLSVQLSATYLTLNTPTGWHDANYVYGQVTGDVYCETASGEDCYAYLYVQIYDKYGGILYDSTSVKEADIDEARAQGPITASGYVPEGDERDLGWFQAKAIAEYNAWDGETRVKWDGETKYSDCFPW